MRQRKQRHVKRNFRPKVKQTRVTRHKRTLSKAGKEKDININITLDIKDNQQKPSVDVQSQVVNESLKPQGRVNLNRGNTSDKGEEKELKIKKRKKLFGNKMKLKNISKDQVKGSNKLENKESDVHKEVNQREISKDTTVKPSEDGEKEAYKESNEKEETVNQGPKESTLKSTKDASIPISGGKRQSDEIKPISKVPTERKVIEESKVTTTVTSSTKEQERPTKSSFSEAKKVEGHITKSQKPNNSHLKKDICKIKTPSDNSKNENSTNNSPKSNEPQTLKKTTTSDTPSKEKKEEVESCVEEKCSKLGTTGTIISENPFVTSPSSELQQNSNTKKPKCDCLQKDGCRKENQSVFAEDCGVCSKKLEGKNKSNSNRKHKGLESTNLFGTPKTKIKKDD